jgi:hypothetical protein
LDKKAYTTGPLTANPKPGTDKNVVSFSNLSYKLIKKYVAFCL